MLFQFYRIFLWEWPINFNRLILQAWWETWIASQFLHLNPRKKKSFSWWWGKYFVPAWGPILFFCNPHLFSCYRISPEGGGPQDYSRQQYPCEICSILSAFQFWLRITTRSRVSWEIHLASRWSHPLYIEGRLMISSMRVSHWLP